MLLSKGFLGLLELYDFRFDGFLSDVIPFHFSYLLSLLLDIPLLILDCLFILIVEVVLLLSYLRGRHVVDALGDGFRLLIQLVQVLAGCHCRCRALVCEWFYILHLICEDSAQLFLLCR